MFPPFSVIIFTALDLNSSSYAIIKRKWINRFRIKNYRHAYILVFEYIETFYNTTRIHSHCNYMSPNEFEKAY
nr:IS3 family transposase [Clostridium liquoris]